MKPSAHDSRTPGWPAWWNTTSTSSTSGPQVVGAQVGPHELDATLERLEVAELLVDVVVVAQAVDDADLVPGVDERGHEVGPDEAGAAGHECSHARDPIS